MTRFDDLPVLETVGIRHAWHEFGPDDELGTIGRLSPAGVLAAAGLVRTGETIRLDLPLTHPSPPLFGREPLEHHKFATSRQNWDERLDNFFPQGSTQWDGLRHVRCRELGFYGGVLSDPTDDDRLGIDRWAEHGIIGRGVLLDVAALLSAASGPGGGAYDAAAGTSIPAETLQSAADRQGTDLRPGDILCVRTGWMAAYARRDAPGRAELLGSRRFSGLAADEAMARWLWDHEVAAVAVDNPAVEVSPGDPAVGSLHRRLIPGLGMALGELFDFEALSRACAVDSRHEFFFVSAPLYLVGGIGSPANAYAIR